MRLGVSDDEVMATWLQLMNICLVKIQVRFGVR